MVTNTLSVLQRENARLQAENQAMQQELGQLRAFVETLRALALVDTQMTSDAGLLPLLHRIFQMSMDLLNAPEGSLLLLDEDARELQFVLVKGQLAEGLLNYRIPADEGIAGWVIQNRQPALVRDVRHDPRFSHTIDEAFKFRTQSIVAVPLIGGGTILGVMEALNQPVDVPFSERDLTLLHLICRFMGEMLAHVEHPPASASATPTGQG